LKKKIGNAHSLQQRILFGAVWTGRRILKELADTDRRHQILLAFWRYGDAAAKATAIIQLSKALHFRDETIRKMPAEKKAELLASRIAAPEFERTFETALMQYHTHEKNDMLAAFLDRWGIPHVNGSIETEEYKLPSQQAVRDAVTALGEQFDRRDIAIYLASAGLLMANGWPEATWPVVDELRVAAPFRAPTAG
jgi:hypothetical protein